MARSTKTPGELMRELRAGIQGIADVDVIATVFAIIDDVLDSARLAMIGRLTIEETDAVIGEVHDYIGNYYGND